MKKTNVLIVSVCLSSFIASCSQSDHNAVAESNDANDQMIMPASKNDKEKNVRATKTELNEKLTVLTSQRKKSITINGEKYIYTDDKLQKGSKVRNLSMSEYGTVKGSFVIVLKVGAALELTFKQTNKIAKDTYRVTPSHKEDLITVYNELLSNESFDTVELEVVYSRRENLEPKEIN